MNITKTTKLLTSLLFLLSLILASTPSLAGSIIEREGVTSYKLVHIANKTDAEVIWGEVFYGSNAWCTKDFFKIPPHKSWESTSRGICLIYQINVQVKYPNGNTDFIRSYVEPFGTTWSQFEIQHTSNGLEVILVD